jgi:hypothetical protein
MRTGAVNSIFGVTWLVDTKLVLMESSNRAISASAVVTAEFGVFRWESSGCFGNLGLIDTQAPWLF